MLFRSQGADEDLALLLVEPGFQVGRQRGQSGGDGLAGQHARVGERSESGKRRGSGRRRLQRKRGVERAGGAGRLLGEGARGDKPAPPVIIIDFIAF